MIVGATLSLLLGLEFDGIIFAWSSVKVICFIAFGFAIVVLFLVNEKKVAAYPLIPLQLFTSRSNVAALSIGLLHGISYFAISYYLPLFFQAVESALPLRSGLFVLPFEISLSFPALCWSIHHEDWPLSLIYLPWTPPTDTVARSPGHIHQARNGDLCYSYYSNPRWSWNWNFIEFPAVSTSIRHLRQR